MPPFLSSEEYKQIRELYQKDNANTINLLLFESAKKFYENQLDFKLITPQVKRMDKNIISKTIGVIARRITTLYDPKYREDLLKDFDDISYFGDFATSDSLDVVLTDVPIEVQLFKEETCEDLDQLCRNALDVLKDLRKDGDVLQDSLPNKRQLVSDLTEKIERQSSIIQGIADVKSKEIDAELLGAFVGGARSLGLGAKEKDE